MKRCSKCGAEKPPTEYHRQSDTHDGLKSQCKECRSEKGSESRRQRNADYWRDRPDRRDRREYMREWRARRKAQQ